jgi:hypothetical protein
VSRAGRAVPRPIFSRGCGNDCLLRARTLGGLGTHLSPELPPRFLRRLGSRSAGRAVCWSLLLGQVVKHPRQRLAGPKPGTDFVRDRDSFAGAWVSARTSFTDLQFKDTKVIALDAALPHQSRGDLSPPLLASSTPLLALTIEHDYLPWSTAVAKSSSPRIFLLTAQPGTITIARRSGLATGPTPSRNEPSRHKRICHALVIPP